MVIEPAGGGAGAVLAGKASPATHVHHAEEISPALLEVLVD